jgi:hypothetical protein
MMRKLLILVPPLVRVGCGHDLTLMGQDGSMGTGHAAGAGGRGTLEVQIANRTYTGTWVAAQGGSIGFGVAGRTSFTTMAVDASSTGNAFLHSADGSSLRCRFVYGGMNNAGYGECLDNSGTHYDLQIM